MVYNKGDTITTIISNQVVDPDVESLIVRLPHTLSDCAPYYLVSQLFDMVGIGISWCFVLLSVM